METSNSDSTHAPREPPETGFSTITGFRRAGSATRHRHSASPIDAELAGEFHNIGL